MDYNSEEYLALFKKIKGGGEQPQENNNQMLKDTPNYEQYENLNKVQPKTQMLRETPNYDQYENLNEVQRQPQQPQNFNINEFKIETRVNGQKINEANPNGLNQFMDNNLNEVRRYEKQERMNEVMQIENKNSLAVKQQQHLENLRRQQSEREAEKLNETINFKDADVVTLEMFNRANYNSMMKVAKIVIPK